MSKSIKNYTSSWTANKSVSEIQALLAENGAEKIMIDYNGGEPVSVTFAIKTSRGLLPFCFPANVEKVEAIFLENKKPKHSWEASKLNVVEKEQAKRTAWKNIYDMIAVQMALIKTNQVKLEQLMLGFSPIYQQFESGNLKLESGNEENL